MGKSMEKTTTNSKPITTYSTALGIDIKRCLCIHAVSQLVEITLQSLLYQRQIIPEPVATLVKNDSHAAEQFKTIYEKVTRIIQEAFRTPNIGRIAEFVILIGGTPYSPKEIYRIPMPICTNLGHHRQNEEEEMENAQQRRQMKENNDGKRAVMGECGSTCEELTAKERRLVFSAVALSKTAVGHFENCPMPGKTDKVFMFIRTNGPLNNWTEGLMEDESFELPDDKIQQRRKIRQLQVKVHSACSNGNEQGGGGGGIEKKKKNGIMFMKMENMDEDNSSVEWEEGDENALNSIWYRIAPFFSTLN